VLLACGLGGAPGVVDVGGAVCIFGEPVGIMGIFSTGIVGVDGVAGVIGVSLTEELSVVFTGPGGRGSSVAELAEPGRTIGLESLMLGLSAKLLCTQLISIWSIGSVALVN